MMAGTFGDRIDALREQVGGNLDGQVVVDQAYARYQHEGLDLRHPKGGEARFLANALLANYGDYLQKYADSVLDDGGQDAMTRAMEDLAGDGGVSARAPVDFQNLRRSGHPTVTQGDEVIYDRPAEQHRLSEAEIDAIRRADPTGWVMINGKHVYVGTRRGSA
jgi:hypothetical protein